MHSSEVDGDEGGVLVHPRAGVEVLHTIVRGDAGLMRVPAEDAVGTTLLRILQGAFGNLVAQAKPARAEAVEPARHVVLLAVELLRAVIEPLKEAAQQNVAVHKAIELVAVDGEVALAVVLPYVALVDGHTDQVRHKL